MRVSCAIFRLLVQFPVDTSLLQRYGGTSDDVLRIKVYWVLTSVQQLVEHPGNRNGFAGQAHGIDGLRENGFRVLGPSRLSARPRAK